MTNYEIHSMKSIIELMIYIVSLNDDWTDHMDSRSVYYKD